MISPETVESIAYLARLELTDEEKERYTSQLNSILDYIEKLNELNTDDIEATSHAVEIAGPMREDTVQSSDVINETIEASPDHEDNFFRVPKVI